MQELKDRSERSVNRSNLGVVVIGRNEGQRLVACLNSLAGHTDNVVYVDSGSADNSVQTATRLGAYVVELDGSEPFTAARARNAGFEALRALIPNNEFVQFVDGDCELVSTWIEESMAFLVARPDVAVVCGRRREKCPRQSIYNRMIDIEWDTPVGETLACGGDSLVRAFAFEAAGGFQPQLMAGEEPELCSRLRLKGWRVWRLDSEMTRHDAAITHFRQFWRRSVRCGYAEAEISRLHFRSNLAHVELRQVARTLFWAALVPVVVLLGALYKPAILFGLSIYPVQISRIALRRSPGDSDSWFYAVFITISKFAQLQGFAQYLWSRWQNTNAHPIEYKKLS